MLGPWPAHGGALCINGALRGSGYTVLPTLTTLCFAALFRILWLEFVFRRMAEPKLEVLLYSYPISWTLCTIVNAIVLYFILKKFQSPNGGGKYVAVKG